MTRIWFAILLIYSASATAECRPEGRQEFAEGLEALARADLSVAVVHFTALVQSQPSCAEARNNLAVVEVEQGRLSEAAEELRQALELRPDYERARLNLQRVEVLLAKHTEHTPQPGLTPDTPAAQAPEAAATGAAPSPPVAQAAPPEPTAATESIPVPAGVAALEPLGATAGAIDTERRRVCLYTRTAEVIAPDACFPIAKLHVESWPQWLVTGDTSGQRIRLSDATGRRALKIAPEHAAVTGDVVWVGQNAFSSLAAKVVPWRTIWIVMEKPALPTDSSMVPAIREALQRWRSVWEQKQFDEYVAAYSSSFVPQSEPTLGRWRARKQSLFEQSGSISVQITPPSIFVVDDGAAAITVFDQQYRSRTTAAHEVKALRWQRENTGWKIAAEIVLKPLPNAEPSDK
ncbi:MAG: tetratricopeptide repeat protein [Candidatus Binatia bacterium]